jgi:hypothetical protein
MLLFTHAGNYANTNRKEQNMRLQTTDPFTPVALEKMTVGGEEVPKLAVMVKDDLGKFQLASAVSPGYQLISNEVAQNVMDDIMTRSNQTWHKHSSLWDGRRFSAAYFNDEEIMSVGSGEAQRSLRLGIQLRNSYDGSCSMGIEMFICAYECKNQFFQRNRFGNFVIRHTTDGGNADWDVEDAIQQISLGGEGLLQLAPRFEEMTKKPMTLPLLQGAVNKDLVPFGKWADVLKGIEEETEWGLYNALTSIATHNIKGFGSLSSGQKIGEHFLAA